MGALTPNSWKLTPMKFSNLVVERAKRAKERVRLHAGDGLYLEVTPTGGTYWFWKYRIADKEKRLSLGVYPRVPLEGYTDKKQPKGLDGKHPYVEGARQKRDAAYRLLDDGTDPGAVRKQVRRELRLGDENTFEAVAREWYSKRKKVWAPDHAVDVLRRLEANLFPDLGERPIGEIDPPELLDCVRKIERRDARFGASRPTSRLAGVPLWRCKGSCRRDPAPDLRGALTPHKAENQPAIAPKDVGELLVPPSDRRLCMPYCGGKG